MALWGSCGLINSKYIFFRRFKPKVFTENEQPGERMRLGGGRGRVNLPPCGLVLRFGRFGGFGDWLGASTCLEAEASAD